MENHLSHWNTPDWRTAAHVWIEEQLSCHAIQLAGEIEQLHIRPWSTVLTVPTSEGVMFFKASAPYFGQETALTDFLARNFPFSSPDLLAVDLPRHWMLMRDAGVPVRTAVRAQKSAEPWRVALPPFVAMQKSLASRTDELLALGVFDRRLTTLPTMFEELISDTPAMLLDQPDGLSKEEYSRLKVFVPKFRRMCEELVSSGIPETLHHDDLHDGNLFVRGEHVIFTDWGESAVTYPFFTLVVMMRGMDNSMGVDSSPESFKLRDMYLEQWASFAPLRDLQAIVLLATRIGLVNRALTWRFVISHLPDSQKPEYAIAVPSYLQEFING